MTTPTILTDKVFQDTLAGQFCCPNMLGKARPTLRTCLLRINSGEHYKCDPDCDRGTMNVERFLIMLGVLQLRGDRPVHEFAGPYLKALKKVSVHRVVYEDTAEERIAREAASLDVPAPWASRTRKRGPRPFSRNMKRTLFINGEMLLEELARRGITQKSLAETINVNPDAITKAVNGIYGLEPSVYHRMCDALGTSPGRFLAGKEG